jgi:hypothetical protein
MDCKYTNDGKKVAVVGKLNNQETIVQEIFVANDGSEIPSGENFVVKSIHDQPVESWKSKEAAEIESRLKELKRLEESGRSELRRFQEQAAAKIKALKGVVSKAAAGQLDVVEMFLSGEITHLVINDYHPAIVAFDKEIEQPERYSYDELRLISLYGRSDGTLNWKISQYYYGGGSKREIIPARSYADAVEISQAIYDRYFSECKKEGKYDYRVNPANWESIKEIKFPKAVMEHFRKEAEGRQKKHIAELKSQLAEAEKGLFEMGLNRSALKRAMKMK